MTLPTGSQLTYTYDAAHRLTDIADNLGNRIHYTLDWMGNRTQDNTFDPANVLAQTRSRVYDSLNRLQQSIGASPNEITTYDYDPQGNLLHTTDALSHVTSHSYDALNRLVHVIDPQTGATDYAYNAQDQLTSVTDPLGHPTAYTSNGLGDRLSVNSPDTGITNSTYDAAGNLKTQTDARNQTTTYTYDKLNRLTQAAFADATSITYTYDQGANGIGRLTTMTDPSGSTTWAYDALGRVVRKQQISTAAFTLLSSYDAQGRMTSLTYPSGKQLTYTYDGAGRVLSVSVDGTVLASAILYRLFGPPRQWTRGNGTVYSRSFDLDGRLDGHPLGATVRATSTTTPPCGSPPSPTSVSRAGYDALDRLVSASAYGNLSYSYDTNGNRLSLTNGAANTTYVIAPTSNRLSQITGAGAKSFSYDAAGNTTASGPVSFTYNARGRLASTTQGTTTVSYSHNGSGERVKKTAASNSYFAYDEAGHLLGDYNGSGVALTETVYVGDLPIAVLTTKETLVDNATTANVTVVGTWPAATTVKGYHSTNYQTHTAGSGANTFAWRPTVTSAGSYRVYARWVAAPTHATNALYTINHNDGLTLIPVNQQANGGQWNLLDTVNFAAGTATITLSDLANGTVIADAVKIVSTVNSSTIQYVYADQLNTPRAITNTANTPLWRWDSEPFGSTPPNQDADGNGVVFNYHLRFPGQYWDSETGLYYNYFRDYDSGTGRYVQSDPIGLRGGLNTYAYVKVNPLLRIDPRGLMAQVDCILYPHNIGCGPLEGGGGGGGGGGGALIGAGELGSYCWKAIVGLGSTIAGLFSSNACGGDGNDAGNCPDNDPCDKLLNKNDIKNLKNYLGGSEELHELKEGLGAPPKYFDLYKCRDGRIVIKRKRGGEIVEDTNLNINDIGASSE
ncbi:MAG: RHS repeat-associated core domain-containing protein [Gammaproteobacteria bacterium]